MEVVDWEDKTIDEAETATLNKLRKVAYCGGIGLKAVNPGSLRMTFILLEPIADVQIDQLIEACKDSGIIRIQIDEEQIYYSSDYPTCVAGRDADDGSLIPSMEVATSKLIVTINEEEYCLSEVPAFGFKVVKAEKEKLLGAVDLKMLVNDLGRIGTFICIAYNGVGAAGPKFIESSIDVQNLGYDITMLCDQSVLTVQSSRRHLPQSLLICRQHMNTC